MSITAAQLNTALGGTWPASPSVMKEVSPYGAASQYWYIHGGATYPGRVKFVSTTASDDASTQAAAVLVALKAGPA